jgi:hypothetical protein
MIKRHCITSVASVLGLLCVATLVSATEQTTLRRLAIPNRGQLELSAPASWSDESETIQGNIPTITFHPKTGPGFEILVSVIAGPKGTDYNSNTNVRKHIERDGQNLLPTAMESKLVIKEIAGQTGTGYYYTFTDRAPKPGEYEYMTQGGIGVGDLLLSFTILSHEKEGKVLQGALTMLAGAKQHTGSAGLPDDMKSYALSLPAAKWSLVMDLSGFAVVGKEVSPDSQGAMVMATNKSTGVTVSAFLEVKPDLRTAQACRAFYWSKSLKSPVPKTDIRLFETGQMALASWTVQEFKGVKVQQRNINAYMGHQGVCIDLHLSKTSFRPEDQGLFDRILNSVAYQEKKNSL